MVNATTSLLCAFNSLLFLVSFAFKHENHAANDARVNTKYLNCIDTIPTYSSYHISADGDLEILRPKWIPCFDQSDYKCSLVPSVPFNRTLPVAWWPRVNAHFSHSSLNWNAKENRNNHQPRRRHHRKNNNAEREREKKWIISFPTNDDDAMFTRP